MTRSGCERAALAAATAWLWSAGYCPTSAQAQTPAPGAPTGAREASVDFDIPAQPMAQALNSWALQANAQIFVDPGPVAHLLAPAVKGNLAPRQALRALLARSNLQVAQGTDGVFVIRPRPAPVAVRPPVTPTPAPADSGAPAAAAPPTARASEGPWLLGASAVFAEDSAAATGGASAALAGEYFITDHVAAALAVTTPRTHSFEVPGGAASPAYSASARLQSSAATLKYYFTPESRLDPYVGAGIDVTALYEAAGATGLTRLTVGPTFGAGLDFRLSPHWLLNAAINWAQVRPTVAGSPGGDIHLDPLQFGLGFVYRFGASP
ncbi:MAG: OmpW family outer membrane protein [Steroidobacteraceae bacterium]